MGVQQTKFTTIIKTLLCATVYLLFLILSFTSLTKLFLSLATRVLKYQNIYEHNPNICLVSFFHSRCFCCCRFTGNSGKIESEKKRPTQRVCWENKRTSIGSLVEFRSNFISYSLYNYYCAIQQLCNADLRFILYIIFLYTVIRYCNQSLMV